MKRVLFTSFIEARTTTRVEDYPQTAFLQETEIPRFSRSLALVDEFRAALPRNHTIGRTTIDGGAKIPSLLFCESVPAQARSRRHPSTFFPFHLYSRHSAQKYSQERQELRHRSRSAAAGGMAAGLSTEHHDTHTETDP